MVDTPAPLVSHYRLLSPLGAGGMGEVWLAEDLALPRKVAIKLLLPGAAADGPATARMLAEARAVASIDHPNVVAIHEAGIHEGRPFLVMPYLEGDTLEARLDKGGPLPPREAAAIARAIADALAEVHALGIVHRDLKPANVLLTARGPRVLDFGVAAMADGDSALTRTGTAVGTPLSISPEQLEGKPADARSDLWALGVLLHAALTGAQPFAADSVAAITRRILEDTPRPLGPPTPPALARVVDRLIAKSPARRYAHAGEVVAALDAVLAHTPAPRDEPAMPRLAVLDFEVLGADADDRFLAQGLAEDLLVDLARLPGLHVAARSETLPYRGRSLPARTLARELNVDYIVQGSVRRVGARARISAQLVRAEDGQAAWAERYDRTVEDLFDLQAEVSKAIVDALELRLKPEEREALTRPPTASAQAYAHYLRGIGFADEERSDDNARAEEALRAALALDDAFALAHAQLARVLVRRVAIWTGGAAELLRARVHAERAVALDPALPEAHLALGSVFRMEGDAEAFLREVRAAGAANATDAITLRWLGWSYMALGRAEEAFGMLERAVRLHPNDFSLLAPYVDCANTLGKSAEVERGLVRARELLIERLARHPDDTNTRAHLANTLAQSGDIAAALVQVEILLADPAIDGLRLYNLACALTYAGQHDRALGLLRRMLELSPGYPHDWARKDPDLAPLRHRQEFVELFGEGDA